MNRVVLGEHIHRTVLHRAVPGDHAGIVLTLGNQRVQLHKAAGVQQLANPFTGGQLSGGALLGNAVRIALQDGLLLGKHLLQVLCANHVQSLHVDGIRPFGQKK